MKNKKGDIPVTILVVGVVALLVLALLSFYIAGNRQSKINVNAFKEVQSVYNIAESFAFSNYEFGDKYAKDGYLIKEEGRGFILERSSNNLKIRYYFNLKNDNS